MKHHAHTTSSSHGDRTIREKRRLKAARLFEKGHSQSEVARALGVSREAARKWHVLWKRRGTKGLISKGKPGPKPKLSESKRKKVIQALLQGPMKFGYATDIWTLGRIRDVIKKVANVSYHSGHVWYILQSFNWSCQKPETRAAERDEEAIQHWKRYHWPHIKKKQSE